MNNPHHFYVIKTLRGKESRFFTGSFHKRRFPRLCHFLGTSEIVPRFTPNEREAEFHLSPSETYEAVAQMRSLYPKYNWFCDTAYLQDYTNTAMQKSFLIIVKHKERKSWRYYIAGAHDNSSKLLISDSLSKATPMDIDAIKTTCQAIRINHKDYNYQAMPTPCLPELHADGLEEYLKKNPPKSMYMTFHIKK